MNLLMQRSWHHARRAFFPLGWPGLSACAVTVLTLGYFLLVWQPMQARERALREDAMSLRVQMDTRRQVRTTGQDPSGQLSEFYAYFPAARSSADILEKIYQAAADTGLTLEVGEYRKIDDPALHLSRFDMTFPLSGVSYTKLREFLEKVLRENPSLAVDSLNLSRPSISGGALEAQLRLTWYFRPEGER